MVHGQPAKLDWEKIDELLEAGCTAIEIAGYFRIDRSTIYNRCITDKNIDWTSYSTEIRQRGCSILRAQQYAKAIGKTDQGDNTMLVWLGKTRLKQERAEKEFEAKLKKDSETEKAITINIKDFSKET